MDEQEVYRLRLLSPLHLGERGVGMEETGETVHSDTLFSALCWALREVAGAGWLTEWLEAFARPPAPFLISSTFPWAGDVRFYPRPMVVRPRTEENAPGDTTTPGKKMKKVRYVSEALFHGLLAGRDLRDQREKEKENFLPGGLWITAAEREKLPVGLKQIWSAGDPVPHVALDRAAQASALYHVGETRYSEECGLWFAARWREPAWREPIEMALKCLGEAGVGGERSAGRGQFRSEPWADAAPPPMPGEGRPAATLSLYHPTRAEVERGGLDEASYRLALRRGWLGSEAGQGRRSRAVRMLAEGAMVAPAAGDLGDLVDVTPEGFAAHPVYRYGLAFLAGAGEGDDG